jgi:hypothetical protein
MKECFSLHVAFAMTQSKKDNVDAYKLYKCLRLLVLTIIFKTKFFFLLWDWVELYRHSPISLNGTKRMENFAIVLFLLSSSSTSYNNI